MIELLKEKKESVYKYNINCTDVEEQALMKIAVERFAKDKTAQLEYAVKCLLEDLLKGDKNGSANIDRK